MKATNTFNSTKTYLFKSILFCIVFTVLFVAFSFTKSFVAGKFERIAHGVIGTIAAVLTTYLFLKFDKKSFAAIGLNFEKTTLKKFVTGVLIGIAIMGLLIISVIYFSDLTITANRNSSMLNFLYCTLPLIPLAFMEELGFRAYPLVLLKDKTGVRNSIIITSILFALYHIVNGWAIQNSFLGAGVWGIIYGLAAIYSNGISMPTGMHYAANLTNAAFGISDDSFNLWTLKQNNGLSLENYQSSQLATLIPQISLLISGVLCMEWYLRKKNYR
jgi:membrane protease YdiL (CAAX protease family)